NNVDLNNNKMNEINQISEINEKNQINEKLGQNLFLQEINFNKSHEKSVFLRDTSRHMILLSRCYKGYDDYIPSIINYITKNSFILSDLILISCGPIYTEKPFLHIPDTLKIQNINYNLKSIIFRKRRASKKGHFYTVSNRDDSWLLFNDEKIEKLEDTSFLATDQAYMLFYERN
ncbi:ubiquitinyl hydrolase, Protein containing Peptidase C19, partial [Pseudoloma neurophilia]